MKKLSIAIAVSSALISGASFAGNVDNMIFQAANHNEVNVTQNTTGDNPADGNRASETIRFGDHNKIDVLQTGERNKSKTAINAQWHKNSDHNKLNVEQVGDDNRANIALNGGYSEDNRLSIMQEGDDNKSKITLERGADGNVAKVNIHGSSFFTGSSDNNRTNSTFGRGADDNRLMIDINKGSDNVVKTSVADYSMGNSANVGMYAASHNKVTIDQDGDDNRAKVDISFGAHNDVGIAQTGNNNKAKVDISFGFGNDTDIAQDGDNNRAVVDITPGFFTPSIGNDTDIDQNGHGSVAKVSLHGSSYNNIGVTQTNNDNSTVTASYSNFNSAVVVQN